MNRSQRMALFGGVGLIIGALLPWASLTSLVLGTSLSAAGYEGDGLLTGALGLVFAIVALSRKGTPGKRYSIALGLAALVAGWIALSAWARLTVTVSGMDSSMSASVGPGVYLTIVGAVLGAIGAFQKVPPQQDASPTQSDQNVPAAAGWKPDPLSRHEYRYWNGSTWTQDVSDGGVTGSDPIHIE